MSVDGISDPNVDRILRTVGPMGQRPAAVPPVAVETVGPMVTLGLPDSTTGEMKPIELPVAVAGVVILQSILGELVTLNATLKPFAEKFGGKGKGLFGL